MSKIGLVLEGGGIRSLYQSGVLDAFMENNIEFRYVIGVSAGSCNGVSFLGKNLHRMRDITMGYSGDKRYKSVKSILKNGEYLNSKWIFSELSYEIFPLDYETYEKANATMCAVATNAETGLAEYFYPTDFRGGCEELRASCALPLATMPVEINGKLYYDGGIADSIPLKHAFEDDCDKCVVILTQDKDYVKKPVGPPAAVHRLLKKYPMIAQGVLERHNMYNAQREYVFEQHRLGHAFVICPEEPLNCSTLNVPEEQQKRIYKLGYEQGVKLTQSVKAFIKD